MDGLIIGVILIVIAWRAFAMARVYLEENKRPNAEQSPDTIPEQADTSQQIDIIKATDSLSKTDKDGNPLIASRLSGIYALEQIAKDNIAHHIKIIEILCTYIRDNSPKEHKQDFISEADVLLNRIPKLRKDIEEALNTIGRLQTECEQENRLDLSNCNLQGAFIPNINMKAANLSGANLIAARFNEQKDFTNTIFWNANMSNIYLTGVNLDKASTFGAYAYEGDFSQCKNLTQDQISVMLCGKNVKIPKKLKRPDHWPKKESSYDDFMKAYDEWQEQKNLKMLSIITKSIKKERKETNP